MPDLMSKIKSKLSPSTTNTGSADSTPFVPPCFAGTGSLSDSFQHETGAHGWGNAELQNYINGTQCSFMRSSKGEASPQLVISASADNGAGRFESARLRSKFSLRDGPGGAGRGYLCARITAPVATGIWPAFWLLPSEPFSWPTDGEIDILETWNGRRENGTCLHWGQYDGADYDKHRVWSLEIADMDRPEGHTYGLAWDQGKRRLVWYADGKPEMRAKIPGCMRKMGEFQVMLNIAMGGNVQQGRRPVDGTYEMVVHELEIRASPPGGWDAFESDWKKSRDGNTM